MFEKMKKRFEPQAYVPNRKDRRRMERAGKLKNGKPKKYPSMNGFRAR